MKNDRIKIAAEMENKTTKNPNKIVVHVSKAAWPPPFLAVFPADLRDSFFRYSVWVIWFTLSS